MLDYSDIQVEGIVSVNKARVENKICIFLNSENKTILKIFNAVISKAGEQEFLAATNKTRIFFNGRSM